MQDNLFPIDDKHFSPRYLATSLVLNAVVKQMEVCLISLTAIPECHRLNSFSLRGEVTNYKCITFPVQADLQAVKREK